MRPGNSLVLWVLLCPLFAFGQTISNIRIESTHDKVFVVYDLQSDKPQDIGVVFELEGKGKVTPKSLSGDVMRVAAGQDRRIEWEVFKDIGSYQGNVVAVLSFGGNTVPVVIGTQTWMSKNLNVDRFRNGDLIRYAASASEWKDAGESGEAAWCYYDNKPENGDDYGKLYNWYAVNDSRGLCPTGWHVPSDEEWTTLENDLGSSAGGKLKSTTGWNSPNAGATNSSGFNALPGGYRGSFGGFGSVGNDGGYWWSSSDAGSGSAWYRYLNYYAAVVNRSNFDLRVGFSVRCAR
ncbi:MAG: fibrobacter succinogenes major paralogous domain-containing protein, partial [Bacteroidia bacterium]